jgi:hypothetical protein
MLATSTERKTKRRELNMNIIETKRPLNSWECYTPDMIFLNCAACAWQFAEEYGVDLSTGRIQYGETETGIGVSECYECGHETDYPLTCDGCGEYLAGNLTNEGVEYLKEGKFPKWLRDYYLTDYLKAARRGNK